MKKLLLFLIGLLPFALGFAMNALLMANMNFVLPYKLIGIIWLLLWGFFGYLMRDYAGSGIKSAAIAHSVALADLLLLLYQELVLGRYWLNFLGSATQFYYLPVLNISFTLSAWATDRIWVAYIVSFTLTCAAFFIGCGIRKRHTK